MDRNKVVIRHVTLVITLLVSVLSIGVSERHAAFAAGHVGWEIPVPGSLDARMPNQ